MRVSVLTNDKYLLRLVEIKLQGKAEVISDFDSGAEVIIYDCDSKIDMPISNARVLRVSRTGARDSTPLPPDCSFFENILSEFDSMPQLYLSTDGKHASIRGRRIKLTSHEYALLSLLISGSDNYTSREEISNRVWNGATDSLVNVYIHYLREKLETDREKVILSSRKHGYKINPIYINKTTEPSSERKGDLP